MSQETTTPAPTPTTTSTTPPTTLTPILEQPTSTPTPTPILLKALETLKAPDTLKTIETASKYAVIESVQTSQPQLQQPQLKLNTVLIYQLKERLIMRLKDLENINPMTVIQTMMEVVEQCNLLSMPKGKEKGSLKTRYAIAAIIEFVKTTDIVTKPVVDNILMMNETGMLESTIITIVDASKGKLKFLNPNVFCNLCNLCMFIPSLIKRAK